MLSSGPSVILRCGISIFISYSVDKVTQTEKGVDAQKRLIQDLYETVEDISPA